MQVPAGSQEPVVRAWNTVSADALLDQLAVLRSGRPGVLAVDGRSGAGKSSLARVLSAAVPASAIVATDDIAWHYSMFDWAGELVTEVIDPVRAGRPVRYRPPGWVQRGRPGAVVVEADRSLLIIEGVGSSQRRLAAALDASIWVQSDVAAARDLGIARDIASGANGDAAASTAFWDSWAAAEEPFLADETPWTRADAIVAGVPLATTDHISWLDPRPAV